MIIYWKYRESSKMLVVPDGSVWYMSCETNERGSYMLLLFADHIRMVVDDTETYARLGHDIEPENMREYFNSIIDETVTYAAEAVQVLNLEEVKEEQFSKYWMIWSGDDDDDDDDYPAFD